MDEKDLHKLAELITLKMLSSEQWLDKQQAASYAKIGQKRLVSLAKDNKINGFPDPDQRGQWLFEKGSLHKFRLCQLKEYSNINERDDDTKVVNNILKDLGL